VSNLLDLDTILVRNTIKVDGVAYELRHREELSLVEEAGIRRTRDHINALSTDDEESAAERVKALEQFIGIISPDLPIDKLTDVQKVAVIMAWVKQYTDETEEDEGQDPQ